MTGDQWFRLLEALLLGLPTTLAAIGALIVSLRTDRRVVKLPSRIIDAAQKTDDKIDAVAAEVATLPRVPTGTTIPPPFGRVT